MRDSTIAVLVALFFASELALALRRRSPRAAGATGADRGSLGVLWIVITMAIVAAVALSGFPKTRLPFSRAALRAVAIVLLVGGIAFRWWAVMTLGKFFTVDVATHADHVLVDTGPFRLVRHPSYTGLLLAFLGFGISFGNALSLVVLMTPIVLAFAYRMRVEEKALRKTLGAPYEAYCARTKRLIPGVI